MNDSVWALAQPTDEMFGNQPYPGKPHSFNTEIRVVYTHEAVYLGFYAFDPHPDSLLQQLTGRDGDGNSDYVGFTLNCYQNGLTAYTFAVSPRGEQYDARVTVMGEDVSWNAVWDCKTKVVENGWIAEFKIPYAALRFPNQEVQTWGFNAMREIRRYREQAFWNFLDPAGPNYLAQLGTLKGIEGIKPPKRIFFYPYLSGYSLTSKANGNSFAYNAGMDMKIGLNEAYTLDATLIPDFGQTISDQLILNLTPYEIQYQENRQFFNEGTELFARGGLFYSRRIGGTPIGAYDLGALVDSNETVTANPGQTHLLNATKITGRNQKGLAVAVINAITGPVSATIKNNESGEERKVVTDPLTNYNVLVLDQNLKNKSYITLTNTNVTREGNLYDANVTGLQTRLQNKKNSYAVTLNGAYSNKRGKTFLGYDLTDKRGYQYSAEVGKVSGNFTWAASQSVMTNTFDPNDLGFLAANNDVNYAASLAYTIYKPFWKVNKAWASLDMWRNYLYAPNAFKGNFINAEIGAITKKFLYWSISANGNPTNGYDYFEPRVDGLKFRTFKFYSVGSYWSSDYRKRLAIDFGTGYGQYENKGQTIFNWRISPRFRLNDKWMFVYVYSSQNRFNDRGFATFSNGEPIFGRRDNISHTNVLTVTFAFNPVNSMNVRFRHYWGYSKYYEFYSLNADGTLGQTTYNGYNAETNDYSLANRSFNSFTVDFFYRWIFRPGSEMIFAWKYAIVNENKLVAPTLAQDISQTFEMPYTNSVSLRLVYFLDYRMLTKNKGEGVYKYQ